MARMGRTPKYRLLDLEVNEELFVPCPPSSVRRVQQSIVACWVKLRPKRFTSATRKDGVLVKRIE
jgi:hypothetical protein